MLNTFETPLETPSIKPTLITPPIMLQETTQNVTYKDITTYAELVKIGQFYEFLQKEFTNNIYPDNSRLEISNSDESTRKQQKIARKKAKELIFQVLFTSNLFFKQKKAYPKRMFKKIFPTVYELLSAFKKDHKELLPIMLQKIEACLILDIIAKRISREKPGIPIFTIHDSIVTTVNNLEYVKSIMKSELEKHVGVAPSFKVEYWEEEEKIDDALRA